MAPDHILAESLSSAKRLCPVPAGSARINGRRLSMRVGRKMIRLTAPPTFLAKMFDWCQGDMSLADIQDAAIHQFGDAPFMDFIKAMLQAGVLIDAANLLAHTATNAQTTGLPIERAVWPFIRSTLRPPRLAHVKSSVVASFGRPELTPLLTTIAKRHSAPEFGAAMLTTEQLTLLLYAAYGKCADHHHHRPVASAGAFYRIDFHIVLLKPVGMLRTGLYKVEFDNVGSIHLELIDDAPEDIPRLLFAPHQLHHAAGMLILSVDLALPALKYRNRAYPFLLLEAGGIIQNIALIAAEQNVEWRPIGGFDENSVATLCRLPDNHNVLVTGLFGTQSDGTNQSRAAVPLTPEFSWTDNSLGLPFHMGMARIPDDSLQPAAYSWGRDIDAARAYDKAVAEATERHAYHTYREEICRLARYGDFPRMCNPADLLGHLPSQYRATSFPYGRFNDDETYLWTQAVSLLSGQEHWVPAACVFAKDAIPDNLKRKPLSMATSSGCASGISAAHAQENAIFELLERDAFVQHWFAQRGGHRIIETTLPQNIHERLSRLREAGCVVHVQLLDHGLEPAWLCTAQHEKNHFTAIGAGAGLCAADALVSALSEVEAAAYSRLRHPYTGKMRPEDVAFPQDHANLFATRRYFKKADVLMQCVDEMSFEEAESLCTNNYTKLLQKLTQAGLDPLWVDLSLPDAPATLAGRTIFSGRALIPGLTPLTFGTGRMPLAMDRYRLRTARFPHPFP